MTLVTRDDIEERAAIVADGEKVSQIQADRMVAWEYGYRYWGELVRAVEAGWVER